MVELVSPICRYDDIPTIQEIVRALRSAGAKVNDSCGIHIHVDAAPHTVTTLRNIVNIMAAKEDLLYKALQVKVERENYCQKADTRFLDEMNQKRPSTMEELETLWYNGPTGRYYHYDHTRYHGLNLHSVFSNAALDCSSGCSIPPSMPARVKSYIQLCLAISHQALVQKRASHARTHSDNEKYTFRTWLLRLGAHWRRVQNRPRPSIEKPGGEYRLERPGAGPSAKRTAGEENGWRKPPS